MAGILRLVLGDQLTDSLSSLRDLGPADTVLMAEVMAEATYVRHHKQKLVMVFAAMRRFAERLRGRGVTVRYVSLDDPDNTHTLDGEVLRALAGAAFERVVVTEPGEWRLAQAFEALALRAPAPLEVRPDDRFICPRPVFEAWAAERRELRMEFFYREMRRRTGLLMDGDQPAGGRWNFDAENRRRLPKGQRAPERLRIAPAPEVEIVRRLVEARFADHFGDTATFGWATSHEEAEQLRDHFIAQILPGFGDWQDAMKGGEPFLWHARISAALNIGLLDPLDVCRRAEAAWRAGRAPLNAVEGFVRQVLGWREFVRGVYWLQGPDYTAGNALAADRALPWFYWSGETDMACVRDVVGVTRRHAYAHHIQRLMVTGNLALLLGVEPAAVNDWYMVVYIDAFEWVEAPNTHGMALFADGGVVGSKPYAASGAYINRMSDYCAGCAYDVRSRYGERACPFNVLYWDFLLRHRDRLGQNPRLAMPYRNLARMAEEHDTIRREAEAVRRRLGAHRVGEAQA
jgi:deoxyribodipyrimidine photolyase-related protein